MHEDRQQLAALLAQMQQQIDELREQLIEHTALAGTLSDRLRDVEQRRMPATYGPENTAYINAEGKTVL